MNSKMMHDFLRNSLFLWIILFTSISFAQRKYGYDHFSKKGEKLIYSTFDAEDVVPGSSGRSVKWDFSTLQILPKEIVQKKHKPDSLAKAEFPEINVMEITADSAFTALKEEYGRVYKLGYIDKKNNIKIKYPEPLLISRFPISYTDVVSRGFSMIFEMKDRKFEGKGEVKIEADGYGTLLLPNKTYQNVLRLRIVQNQTNHIEKYDVDQKYSVVTYVWYEEDQKNPILILKKTQVGNKSKKEGMMLKETPPERGFDRGFNRGF